MPSAQGIETIRSEIIANHVLMHVTSLVVLCIVLTTTAYVERQRSVLSVIVPLVTVFWAAAMVRFDYLIHRQGAYISFVERTTGTQGWETWRTGLTATVYVMPFLDALSVLAIVAPTVFVLFGPAKRWCEEQGWRFGALYRWMVLVTIVSLLGSLGAVPWLARQ